MYPIHSSEPSDQCYIRDARIKIKKSLFQRDAHGSFSGSLPASSCFLTQQFSFWELPIEGDDVASVYIPNLPYEV